ncbi:hypothetical protein [Streptomyces sp. enrichment culture]
MTGHSFADPITLTNLGTALHALRMLPQ